MHKRLKIQSMPLLFILRLLLGLESLFPNFKCGRFLTDGKFSFVAFASVKQPYNHYESQSSSDQMILLISS